MTKTFVIIPAFNEEKNIAPVLQELNKLNFSNIIVINDGSSDKTSQIARDHQAIVLDHFINCGPGAAVQTGINAALNLGAEYLVTMDADNQHYPDDIPKLLEEVQKENVDVCLGSRFLQKNNIPNIRKGFNFMGNLVTFLIAGVWVSDSQCGLKVFTRKAAQTIQIRTAGFEFCSETIWQIAAQGLKFKEIPVKVSYTKDSLAKGQNFANGVKTALKLVVRTLMR